jgi:transcriptional regulator with XRE-family HTH domain
MSKDYIDNLRKRLMRVRVMEVHRESGVSRDLITAIKLGKPVIRGKHNPSVDSLERISKALDKLEKQ